MDITRMPQKPKEIREVYMDNAAATKMDASVFDVFMKKSKAVYANPSSIHSPGCMARKDVELARGDVSRILHTQPDTILFTSGATESCNLAISGVLSGDPGHVIAVRTEHHAVLRPIAAAEQRGWSVTYIDVDEYGRVAVQDIARAITDKTILVCVMYANNEMGAIAPIAEIGKTILKWRKKQQTVFPYFFTDACQIPGNATLDVEKLHVDLMTLSSAKIHGPKGVGLLYKRRGVVVSPQLLGGGQEFGLRAGTEHGAAIVAFAKALEVATNTEGNQCAQIREVRNYLWQCIVKNIPGAHLHGPTIETNGDEARLANNLLISFEGIEGEVLQLYLDAYGIYVGVGAACTVEESEKSHVLEAMGLSADVANTTIRWSMSKYTTNKDVEYVMHYLPGVVETIRLSHDI